MSNVEQLPVIGTSDRPAHRRVMTDDDARTILQNDDCAAWIRWDDVNNKPDWWSLHGKTSITVDGDLTIEQMRALIHFAPKEPS